MLGLQVDCDEQGPSVKTRLHRPTSFAPALPIPDDPGTQKTSVGVASMFGALAKYDADTLLVAHDMHHYKGQLIFCTS